MTRKVTSYRLPEITLSQIKQLTEMTGSSDANVIAFAIDRMYHQEKFDSRPPSNWLGYELLDNQPTE